MGFFHLNDGSESESKTGFHVPPRVRNDSFHAICRPPRQLQQLTSNFQPLRKFKRVDDVNPEVPDHAFEPGADK